MEPEGVESGTCVLTLTAVSMVEALMAEFRADAEAVLVAYIEPVWVTELAASVCWSRGWTLAWEV